MFITTFIYLVLESLQYRKCQSEMSSRLLDVYLIFLEIFALTFEEETHIRLFFTLTLIKPVYHFQVISL